jgi:hypothetical protein
MLNRKLERTDFKRAAMKSGKSRKFEGAYKPEDEELKVAL